MQDTKSIFCIRRIVVTAALLVAGVSHADFQWSGCPSELDTKVQHATACDWLTPPDQSKIANAENANNWGGMFGYTDWVFGFKDDEGQGSDPWFPGGTLDGTWDLADAAIGIDLSNPSNPFYYVGEKEVEVALVFKDGAETNLVGYLVDGSLTGTWSTPFTDPPFDFPGNKQQAGVSHITALYRVLGDKPPSQTNPAPVPATLALLGLGGVMLGWRSRKTSA